MDPDPDPVERIHKILQRQRRQNLLMAAVMLAIAALTIYIAIFN